MKTLLEAIQQYTDQFISTLQARANTTYSNTNKGLHLLMNTHIVHEDWDSVKGLLMDEWYHKPLKGVVYCLDTYSEIEREVWFNIVELFENGDIV